MSILRLRMTTMNKKENVTFKQYLREYKSFDKVIQLSKNVDFALELLEPYMKVLEGFSEMPELLKF